MAAAELTKILLQGKVDNNTKNSIMNLKLEGKGYNKAMAYETESKRSKIEKF